MLDEVDGGSLRQKVRRLERRIRAHHIAKRSVEPTLVASPDLSVAPGGECRGAGPVPVRVPGEVADKRAVMIAGRDAGEAAAARIVLESLEIAERADDFGLASEIAEITEVSPLEHAPILVELR